MVLWRGRVDIKDQSALNGPLPPRVLSEETYVKVAVFTVCHQGKESLLLVFTPRSTRFSRFTREMPIY